MDALTGLRPGEASQRNGSVLLNATLRTWVSDETSMMVLQEPLEEIAEEQGAFISEGKSVPST